MDIQSIKISAKQLKRNIAKLKKKNSKSDKTIRAIERAERKLKKRIAVIDAFGVSEKSEPRRKKKIKQNKFGFGDYNKYINSREWAARKASYYETHHKECRSCGSDERDMHLHHRTYARIYQEEDGDLVPLCSECHAMLHLFQKSFKLPVEDATSIWLSVTNGAAKKKKIRSALRELSYQQFQNLWKRRARAVLPPVRHLEKTIERGAKGDLGARNDFIKDREAVKKSIAFSQRTGILADYDRKVNLLIKKLERQ
jgi:hypothetical protein